MDTPDYLNKIAGIRSVYYSNPSNILGMVGGRWSLTDPFEAICNKTKTHSAPAPNCTCGVYNYNSIRHPQITSGFVRGAYRVEGKLRSLNSNWGTIHLHDFGFRASHSKIEAMIYPFRKSEDRNYLDRRHLELLESMELHCMEHDVPFIYATDIDNFCRDNDLVQMDFDIDQYNSSMKPPLFNTGWNAEPHKNVRFLYMEPFNGD